MLLNSRQIAKNLEWLRINSSTPVRYLTHKHLLSEETDSRLISKLRQEVERSQCVREIFGKQEQDGSWHAGGSWAPSPSYRVKGGNDPYTPKYVTTTWILPLLGEMGYTASDRRVLKACQFIISNGYYRHPIFKTSIENIRQSDNDLSPCRFAQYMIALGAVGFDGDQRVEKGYQALLSLQGDDGGWAFQKHSEQMGWTRSCLFSTYHATMALYHSNNPAYKEALTRGIKFMLWHLSTKKDDELHRFYFHGHNMVRELIMFSELGIGLQTRAVRIILKWLMTLYDEQEGCFKYMGKPISKYTKKKDGIDSRVAKYRFYHVTESDWLTYHMTKIAIDMQKHKKVSKRRV